MKKTLKIVLISLGVLVALLVVVAGVALLSLDSMVETGVRKGGSYALKTPVELQSASISVLHGTLDLKGFSVANPQGFSANKALSLGEVHASIEPGSVSKDVIVIPEVVIRRPEINVEGSLKDGSNIQKLLKNLDETIGSTGGAKEPEKPEKPTSADEGPGRSLKIGRILIEDAKVSLGADFLGGQAGSVTLPRLELKDIGTSPDGTASPAEVSKKVLEAILVEAAKSKGQFGDAVRQLGQQTGGIKQLGGELKDVGKGLMDDVKGIFKKDAKNDEKK